MSPISPILKTMPATTSVRDLAGIARINDQVAEPAVNRDHFGGDDDKPGHAESDPNSGNDLRQARPQNDLAEKFAGAEAEVLGGAQINELHVLDRGNRRHRDWKNAGQPSAFAYVYGSWNADSGIYIGGCRDCHAVITNSQAEKNAIGYSGTNAGGELLIINSEWDHNATGLVPNTLTSEPDPPQDGVTITSNYIHDNNDADVPGSGIQRSPRSGTASTSPVVGTT